MANVRCPMCSKVNAPDAEACAYCGARLKPVRPPSAPSQGGQAYPAPNEGDEPDWLNQIRQDSPETTSSASPFSGLESSSQPGDADEDAPDWLSRIRDRARQEDGEDSTDSQPLSENQDGPDWLKDLQSSSAPPESVDAFRMDDDWLGSLQNAEPGTPFANLENSGGSTDTPDWLRGISDQPEGEDSLPDWLNEGSPSSFEAAAPAAGSTPQDAASEDDWMNQIASWQSEPVGDQPSTGSDAPAQMGSTPAEEQDWLSSLNFDSQSASERESEAFPPASSENSAWDTGQGDFNWAQFAAPAEDQPAPLQAASDEGLPDWLSGMQDSTDDPPASTFSFDEPAAESGSTAAASAFPSLDAESDWLQKFNTPDAEETAFPAPLSPAAETGVPDWLNGDLPETLSSQPAPTGEEGLPAWLSGDMGSSQMQEPDLSAASSAAPEGDLPDWLAGAAQAYPADAAAEPPPAEQEPAEEAGWPGAAAGLPAWMSEEPSSTRKDSDWPAAPESVDQPAQGEQEALPEWFSSSNQPEVPAATPSVEDTQPTWLSGVYAQSEEATEAGGEEAPLQAESAAGSAPFIDENVPDWLRDFNAQPPSGGLPAVPPLLDSEESARARQEAEADQPFAVDLPEWLSEDSAVETLEARAELEPTGEELAQADLPEWVKDMRPMDSIISGEMLPADSDQRVEKAGPLAGLRGVLPSEEMVTHYRKLPVYSAKLRVTEKQRSHAALLDTILSQETQALMLPPKRSHAPQLLARILLALLILAALFAPRLLAVEPLAMPLSAPGLAPDEMQDMFDVIDGAVLQDAAPVLLAVDYTPAMAGEMRLSAAPIIDHLMARNARIVVLSTEPTGPALAHRLLEQVAAGHQGYNLEAQTVNLGYLPGGVISLLEFARQPQLAAPVTLTGEPAWSSPILSDVTGLQDFSQVIVLTDSPETGRGWVEQVQPSMGDVPLLMVASAQAAPMLAPYVQSGQIAGMVSGLLGGLMYGQQVGTENNPAVAHFATYQIGVLMAFGLVLVGGLVSGLRSLFQRRNKDEE